MEPRFGIAEWFGFSFEDLSSSERKEFATYERKSILSPAELARLLVLRKKDKKTEKEQARLEKLEALLHESLTTNKLCPFKHNDPHPICTKDGGVCSFKLYNNHDGVISAETGDRGLLRALCPYRFHESGTAFTWVGREILNSTSPVFVKEVGFLQGNKTLDSDADSDAGRIDMILLDLTNGAMSWCATEVQAVYFSGKTMSSDFKAICNDVDSGGDGFVFPTETRRPDYRSSGPKRLMPQLQTKVPTLRRWGKKMAVIVDSAFFQSIGNIQEVPHLSNSDIVWFVVDFRKAKGANSRRYELVCESMHFTCLEESVKGLTGGEPVSLEEFESRIMAGLSSS